MSDDHIAHFEKWHAEL